VPFLQQGHEEDAPPQLVESASEHVIAGLQLSPMPRQPSQTMAVLSVSQNISFMGPALLQSWPLEEQQVQLQGSNLKACESGANR
jgi:hypothetical protein